MNDSYDVFEPRHEPAKSLYLAFQEEAAHRKRRDVSDWGRLEVDAVLSKATALARDLGLVAPTRAQVEIAERSARGHVDYGAQWAYALARVMREGARA
jgi:hypothetical protein